MSDGSHYSSRVARKYSPGLCRDDQGSNKTHRRRQRSVDQLRRPLRGVRSPGAINYQVSVYDARKSASTRVSVDSAGNEGNADSSEPSISGDGRFVAFASNATNLVAGDSNGVSDIFVHDRQTGATTRVSVDSAGNQSNAASWDPSVSADGRYVAFVSSASNLVAGDTNGVSDVFVHDRQTGITARVSLNSSGNQGNGQSLDPSITADGRFVAFASQASNLVTGDSNGAFDVFLRDRQTGATTRLSVNSADKQGNGDSRRLAISAAGRYVVFMSRATNLAAGDTNTAEDAFVHDRQTGQTTRLSVDNAGSQVDEQISPPSISGDGRFVAFCALVDWSYHLFLRDRQTGQVSRFEHGQRPFLSADGRFVAFDGYYGMPSGFRRLSPQNRNLHFQRGQPTPQTQFRAYVEGTTNQSVAWSIHPPVGSINGKGLYTAPSAVTTPLLVTVNARSVVDPVRSGVYWLPLGEGFGEPFDYILPNPFLDGWKIVDEGTTDAPSDWKVVDGVLMQTSRIHGGSADGFVPDKPGTYLLLQGSDYIYPDPFTLANYTVAARLRSTGDDAIGIMFGYRDSNNYYRFSMDRERKYRRLVKVVNGVFTVLAEDSVAYQTGRWYNVQATLAGASSRSCLTARNSSTSTTSVTIAAALPFTAGTTPARSSMICAVIQRTTLGCTFSFQPGSVDVSAQGATGAVNLVTQNGCPWKVNSNAVWITILGPAEGVGSGTIQYQVAAHGSTARERTISLGGGTRSPCDKPEQAGEADCRSAMT